MGKVKQLKRKVQELEKALAQQREKKNQFKKALKALKKQHADEIKTIAARSKSPVEKKKAPAKPAQTRRRRNSKSTRDELFKRIKANAKNIDFSRIGTASASEKDDLQRIKGIGPFLEEKLNTLGIFTLQQIANFTKKDEDNVTEAIEFFQGRMHRDKWVAQSKKLSKEG